MHVGDDDLTTESSHLRTMAEAPPAVSAGNGLKDDGQ